MNTIAIFKQCWPRSLENRAALRTAVGVVLAIIIAFAFHLDKPYWAGMTVAMVANIYTGNIIDKSIMRLVGTFVGVWAGFYVTHFVVNSFLLYILVNFFIIAAATYYYNFSKYAYAYLLGGIGAFFVVGQLAMDPQSAFSVAIWRPAEIGIGVVVSGVVALFIFPNSITSDVAKEINGLFNAIDALFDKADKLYKTSDEKLNLLFRQENLKIKKKIRKASELISFMHREFDNDKNKIDQFRFFIAALSDLNQAINYFNSLNLVTGKRRKSKFSNLTDKLFSKARQDLTNLQKAFLNDNLKVKLELPVLIAELNDLPPLSSKNELAVAHFFRQTNIIITDLQKILLGGRRQITTHNIINTQQQLRNDPDVLIHSIKAGLSTLLALALWIISDWPGGLAGIISSIIISVKKNLFEMKNTGILRFLGALIGGGIPLAIMYWLPLNLYLLILIIFFAAWGFSYLSFKSTAYSYLGLQANVAVLITLTQTSSPPVEIAAPLERLAGVIIGIFASFVVGNLIWRTDLMAMLQRQFKKLKTYLFHNCVVLLTSRTQGTLYDLTNLFWLCRSLIDTLTNEKLNKDKQARLEKSHDAFRSTVLLQLTLKNIINAINQDEAEYTAAKLKINLKNLEQQVAILYQDSDISELDDIHIKLDKTLVAILRKRKKIAIAAEENLAAYLQTLIRLVEIRRNIE
ncbi:FUSC family protein [Legionella sp. D16C41]|uniref:FUSC family protein n=1 Tax=Legionella sp. D16C41 TaxID=3402688 RepID=UPI003AF5E619